MRTPDPKEQLYRALYTRQGEALPPEKVLEVLSEIYPDQKFVLIDKSEFSQMTDRLKRLG